MNLLQLSSFLVVFSKSKICNFVGLILDEDVSRFEVSMNNWMLMEISIPADKLFDNDKSLSLGKFLSLLQDLLKGSLIA
jgi:hypothetical protein